MTKEISKMQQFRKMLQEYKAAGDTEEADNLEDEIIFYVIDLQLEYYNYGICDAEPN